MTETFYGRCAKCGGPLLNGHQCHNFSRDLAKIAVGVAKGEPPKPEENTVTRAFDDKTSTCGTCIYWAHDKSADGTSPHRLGDCGYKSVPAWVYKHFRKAKDGTPLYSYVMSEHEGLTCWQHTKRQTPGNPDTRSKT